MFDESKVYLMQSFTWKIISGYACQQQVLQGLMQIKNNFHIQILTIKSVLGIMNISISKGLEWQLHVHVDKYVDAVMGCCQTNHHKKYRDSALSMQLTVSGGVILLLQNPTWANVY